MLAAKRIVFGKYLNCGQTFEDAVMQEEIFGPVMPILTFSSLEEAIGKVKGLPHPLALSALSEAE